MDELTFSVSPSLHDDLPIGVRGWASDNYSASETAAVIINPNADTLSLLSWGAGQLQQCNVLLSLLGEFGGSPIEAARLAECVLHFSSQAETVMQAGIERLAAHKIPEIQ